MNPIPTLFAFGQAVGFKIQSLTDRYLQEAGVSPISTFALQRFALIPAIVWSLLFVSSGDILHILHSPQLLFFFIAIAMLWNAQSFLASYVLNTISTVSAFSTLENLIYLPLLLIVGIVLNHDIPNIYSIVAILVLVLAFALQPSHHAHNLRPRFSMPLVAITGLVLLCAVLNALNNGLSRELLGMVSPQVFLGVFGILVTALCWVWTSLLPHSVASTTVLKTKWQLAALIPILWFAASIPETFAFAALPIYTVVSIGMVTFALDTASDLFHKRSRFDLRTAVFIALVFAGTGFAAYSV